MSEGDAVALFDGLAAGYNDWYQTPLGALADALEREAVFALAGDVEGRIALDASCGTGRRWAPGLAAFLAVAGN